MKLESAVEAHEKWQKRLKHFEVGLLHGKLPPEQKESVSREFREGKIDVLVATTVIEVGVDVPNANVMVIHNADRYGLAQLHQLRGRIGRGEHKSYCILSTDGKSEEGMRKLEILAGTTDGFVIAEYFVKKTCIDFAENLIAFWSASVADVIGLLGEILVVNGKAAAV